MDSPFIGMICTFGFNYPPRDWAFCQGQLVSINDYASLYSLLGPIYGGDGRTNFALPNFNGRVAVGQGQAPGTSHHWALGTVGGADTHQLSVAEMPIHSHTAAFVPDGTATVSLTASADSGESAAPSTGDYLAAATPPQGGPDKPEYIYRSSASNSVALAGASISGFGGSVAVGNAGGSQSFNIVQPSLGINYSISLQGLYPQRN